VSTLKETVSGNSLVIVGEEDVVLGFKALGFSVRALDEHAQLNSLLQEIVSEGCAVCLIQEDVYRSAKASLDAYRSLPLPVFLPFNKGGAAALLESIIRDIRLRATGTF